MSIHVSKKIRMVRESEKLGRKAFSEMIGISQRSLEGIENRGTDPASTVLQAVCKAFPKYTFWLTLDMVDPSKGQISPELENIVSEYSETGTDTN